MPSQATPLRRQALRAGHASVFCLLILACSDEPTAQSPSENAPTSGAQASDEQTGASSGGASTSAADVSGQSPSEGSQDNSAGSEPAGTTDDTSAAAGSTQGTGANTATGDSMTGDSMTGSTAGDQGDPAVGDPTPEDPADPELDDPAGDPMDAAPANPDPPEPDPTEDDPALDSTPSDDDAQAQPPEPTEDDSAQPDPDPGESEMVEPDPGDPTDAPAGACEGNTNADFSLVGWAAEAGGTTGGQGGSVITVSTGAELQQAVNEHRDSSGALTIMVSGTITEQNSGVEKIDVKDVANLSIIGAGSGAEFDGIGIKIVRANNIIVRNLKIHHVDIGDKDCISIEGPAHHIWIDHNELWNEYDESVDKDYYDGLLDVKSEAEYITYSWNYLHDSWKTSLVGSSESDTFDRKLTIHHNYFRNCNSRLPLFRGGHGHIFNNLFEDIVDTTINSRIGACIRVENNVFINAQNPWVSAFSDELGAAELICNSLTNSPFVYSDDVRELPACTANVPYAYGAALTETSSVAELVRMNAGAGKLADPTQF